MRWISSVSDSVEEHSDGEQQTQTNNRETNNKHGASNSQVAEANVVAFV